MGLGDLMQSFDEAGQKGLRRLRIAGRLEIYTKSELANPDLNQ